MRRLFDRLKGAVNSGGSRSIAVKQNIIGSLAVKGGSILIQLILVPLTLGYLSDELYGIWLTVSSILLWLNFFDVGFTLGLKNRLAEALAQGDYLRGKRLVSTTYGMMLLIFGPLCVIMVIGVPWVDWSKFLNVSAEYNAQLTQVMRVLAVSFCLQMIFNTITAVLSAYQRVALASAFPVIGNFLSVIVIYLLKLLVPASLLSLAVAISYLPVLVLLLSTVWLFRGQLKEVRPEPGMFDSTVVKQLFTLGYKFFIIQIQLVVLYQTTNVIISQVSTPIAVTEYNIAYKYIGTAMMILYLILNALWPAFTDAYVKGDFKWMNSIYKKMKQVYLVVFLGIVGMVLFSPFVYNVWVGDKAVIPMQMTIAVAVFVAVYSWNTIQMMILNGIGAVHVQAIATVIGMVLHIPLSFVLGRNFGFGAYGVIMSLTIINVFYGILYTYQLNALLKGVKNSIWNK